MPPFREFLLVYPDGTAEMRSIQKSRLTAKTRNTVELNNRLSELLSFSDFGVQHPKGDRKICAGGDGCCVSVMRTKIREDVKLVAMYRLPKEMRLPQNIWAREIHKEDKVQFVLGPVLVACHHFDQFDQEMVPLERLGLETLLRKRALKSLTDGKASANFQNQLEVPPELNNSCGAPEDWVHFVLVPRLHADQIVADRLNVTNYMLGDKEKIDFHAAIDNALRAALPEGVSRLVPQPGLQAQMIYKPPCPWQVLFYQDQRWKFGENPHTELISDFIHDCGFMEFAKMIREWNTLGGCFFLLHVRMSGRNARFEPFDPAPILALLRPNSRTPTGNAVQADMDLPLPAGAPPVPQQPPVTIQAWPKIGDKALPGLGPLGLPVKPPPPLPVSKPPGLEKAPPPRQEPPSKAPPPLQAERVLAVPDAPFASTKDPPVKAQPFQAQCKAPPPAFREANLAPGKASPLPWPFGPPLEDSLKSAPAFMLFQESFDRHCGHVMNPPRVSVPVPGHPPPANPVQMEASPNGSSTAPFKSEPARVQELLTSAGLHSFVQTFVDCGYDNIAVIKQMTEDDFDEVGLKKGHVLKLGVAFKSPDRTALEGNPQHVEELLTNAGLNDFVQSFITLGYDCAEVIKHMTEDDYSALGLKKGHIKKLSMAMLS